MKHVLPRFINPRKPAGQEAETKKKCENNKAMINRDVIHTAGNGGNLHHHEGAELLFWPLCAFLTLCASSEQA